MALVVKQKAAEPLAAVKDGTYRARLTKIKQFTNTYGERLGFEFTIEGGDFDGERVLRRFLAVPYEVPAGHCAAYYPEANALVPVTSVAEISNTPTSKGVAVTIVPSVG